MSLFRRDPADRQLFDRQHLSEVTRIWSSSLHDEVQQVDEERLLASEPSGWVDFFVAKYTREPLHIRYDEVTTSLQGEADIDVSGIPAFGFRIDGSPNIARGTRVTFHVPFDGGGSLFGYRPSSSFMSPMRASVGNGELTFTYLMTEGVDKEAVRREFDHELSLIMTVAGNIAREVDAWNDGLPRTVRAYVDGRRQKLLADRELVDGFGFPVRCRDDAVSTFAVPTTRRRILPPIPAPTTGVARPDPALTSEVFDDILDVCRSMSKVMERSPRAFVGLGEEDLRTHFLVALNAQFGGEATGETFNREGKTDILIRYGDRNIFIAECKFWGGPASLTGAIDQLLGYLAWRDTKAAVLLFSRNQDFSAVVGQLEPVVSAHPNFVREAPGAGETEYRAIVHQRDDTDRKLHLAVLAFDVPR